jgi:hypothetical protein
MATSRHREQQKARQRDLVEELIVVVGRLERGSANYKRAVRFATANLADNTFPYPAPTQVKARYLRELDKLELNSQLSKRAALEDVLERLQSQFRFDRSDWDEVEKLYGKLALVLHLSDGVLVHTAASDGQVAAYQRRIASTERPDHVADAYAEQLREIAQEWEQQSNEPGGDDARHDLSDWSSSGEEDAPGDPDGVDSGELLQGALDVLARRAQQPRAAGSAEERDRHSSAHATHPLGYPLPLPTQGGQLDLENPCHLALACAQQEDTTDGALRLWRRHHLVAHEQAIVHEVLAMLRGSAGRLFAKTLHACDADGNQSTRSVGRGFPHPSDPLPPPPEGGAAAGGGAEHAEAGWYASVGRVEFHMVQRLSLLHLSPQALAEILEGFMARAQARRRRSN